MAARNKQPGKIPAGKAPSSKQVSRDYVEEIRKRAEDLGRTGTLNRPPVTGEDFARRQQEQIEKHMARLRSETLRARNLAQHIDNLSQDVAIRKRNRAMTDSTIVDPGQTQRRTSDKPRAATKTSSFNPLHPSMELPPEELIRLLGLESKKLRKQRKKSSHAKRRSSTSEREPLITPEVGFASLTSQIPAERTEKPATDSMRVSPRVRRQRLETPIFEELRGRLIIPAVAIGLISGIALSGYLFWSQPATDKAPDTSTPVASQSRPAPKPATVSKPGNTSATTGLAPKTKAKPIPRNDPAWQATIQAQGDRLRTEAENRFNARLNTMRAGTTPDPAPPVASPALVPAPDDAAVLPLPDHSATAPVEEATTAMPAMVNGLDSSAATEPQLPDTPMPAEEPLESTGLAPGTDALSASTTDTESQVDELPAEAGMIDRNSTMVDQPDVDRPDAGETPLSGGGNADLF